MPRLKYRTIQNPPAISNITVKEAVELAKAADAIIAARRLSSAKTNGKETSKTIGRSRLTHSPGTSSGTVGKKKKSTTKLKTTRKSVAPLR
jgi:hypothetical protein